MKYVDLERLIVGGGFETIDDRIISEKFSARWIVARKPQLPDTGKRKQASME